MVQILPYLQSPLEQLTPDVNQAVGNVAQGIGQFKANKLDNQILSQLPNAQTPMEFFSAYSKLSPKKQASLQGVAAPFIKNLTSQQEAKNKQLQETKKAEEETKGLSNTLDDLEENVKYTGTRLPGTKSFLRSIPGTEAFEKAQQFDSQGFLAADKVFTHFNKGTVSKEKLQIIRDDLAPNSKYTERTNKARIKALRTVMGLPSNISEEKFDAAVKKAKKGLPLDEELKVEKQERPPIEGFFE